MWEQVMRQYLVFNLPESEKSVFRPSSFLGLPHRLSNVNVTTSFAGNTVNLKIELLINLKCPRKLQISLSESFRILRHV